jgi:RecA/RadA recombinase
MTKRGRPAKEQEEQQTDDVINQIEEHVEQPVIEEIEEEDIPGVEYVSTGADIFDLIGGKGMAWGKMVNIIGDQASSKTLLASEIVAAAHKQFGNELVWTYDDAEAGYSFNSKKIWGIDIVKDDDKPSETLEGFENNLNKKLDKLKDNQRLIYVLDSFDSLTTEEEIEHHNKKMKAIENETKIPGSFGQSKSKGSSEFFRIMRNKIKTKKCLLLIISQVRENIGVMFGSKFVRMGGKALDFYASQIFWLAVAEKHEIGGRIAGITVKIRNSKNKVGKPFREGFITILFDYGVDNITSNLMFLYDLKTDMGKNKTGVEKILLKWDDIELSLKRLIKYIEENNLEQELTKRVKDKWQQIEIKSNTAIGRKSKF